MPAYTSDGERLRNYSYEAAENYVAAKRAIATYNKRTGRITAITFKPLPLDSAALSGKGALRKHAHMGQHYSEAQTVDCAGHKAWRFTPFLSPNDLHHLADENITAEELELHLQLVFRAVPLSCLVHQSH